MISMVTYLCIWLHLAIYVAKSDVSLSYVWLALLPSPAYILFIGHIATYVHTWLCYLKANNNNNECNAAV